MRTLVLWLALLLPVVAQPALTLRLKAPVSFSGVVDRTPDGRVWLKTPEGERVVVNDELAFTDASHQLLEYASLAPGTPVQAELSTGELQLVAARDSVATLLSSGGAVQVPLRALAPQVRSEARVAFRRGENTTSLPLAEAVAAQAAGQGTMVLPELGLARLKTPQGPVVVNLKPELNFADPLHILATLQQRTGDRLHMVARESGDSLAAPLGLCQARRLEVGDAVSVDVPAGSYQLTGVFGRQAQIATPHGLLQLPFRLLPESVLASTLIAVRTYGGEVRSLPLKEALKDEKTQSYMLLLLGAPGINPSSVSGFYDIRQ